MARVMTPKRAARPQPTSETAFTAGPARPDVGRSRPPRPRASAAASALRKARSFLK